MFLYHLHEWQHAAIWPFRVAAEAAQQLFSHPAMPVSYTKFGRTVAAAAELVERTTRRRGKPTFGFQTVGIEGKEVAVREVVVADKPFCRLVKFERDTKRKDPPLLVAAPLSGHWATLLRGTIEPLLAEHEVYVTDWIDAREVPLSRGRFDLDDYIDYLIEFIGVIGPEVHVMAVCQPSVPVLAAVSLLATRGDPEPRSMTLIGGPIDTRVNPTKVNELAQARPLEWFEQNVIATVPLPYPGYMRSVYPGFVQLSGFMSMNLDRHMSEHMRLFQHLVVGDGQSADAHKKFYDEYLAVMDLPAEFYLQTIATVFQEHALPRSAMVSRGRPVRPAKIKRCGLMTIEGELDDISAVGQTRAAHDICSNIPTSRRLQHLQGNVGHFGVFSGRRYRQEIVPLLSDFIRSNI